MKQAKYRNEIKYVCSQAQLGLIENRIKDICHLDPHGRQDGTYLITSIYFDDYYDNCYYENENGVDPREKFRIRIYNRDLNYIVLECKHKQCEKSFKESSRITQEQCHKILHHDWTGWTIGTNPLLNKFFIMSQKEYLRPKVAVEYERTAYVYPQGNIRITFDRYITASMQIMSLDRRGMGRPVMPTGLHVLEVKYDELLPDYLYNALQIEHLRQTAFSKYYICRRFIN